MPSFLRAEDAIYNTSADRLSKNWALMRHM